MKPWLVINAQNTVVGRFRTEKEAASFALPLVYSIIEYRPRKKKTSNVFPYNGGK